MKLYHTSPNEITKIDKYGMFDDCLFFSNEPYFMTQADNPIVYSIEIDEEKIIDVCDLYEESVIQNIMDVLNCNEDQAVELLTGEINAYEVGGDGEDDWWVQAKQGECAKLMGYEACESEDEQGAVWIIPMLGRETELVLEED